MFFPQTHTKLLYLKHFWELRFVGFGITRLARPQSIIFHTVVFQINLMPHNLLLLLLYHYISAFTSYLVMSLSAYTPECCVL